MLENKVNQTSFKATRAKLAQHPIEEVGVKLRDMMPWIEKGRAGGQDEELRGEGSPRALAGERSSRAAGQAGGKPRRESDGIGLDGMYQL